MKKYKSKYLEGKQYYSWEYDEHTPSDYHSIRE